jgi:hypothetical protein
MSFLDDIGNIAKSAVSTVAHVAEDAAGLAGDVVKGGVDVAGGVAKLGEDALGLAGGALGLPIPFNPFEVIKGVEGLAGGLLGLGGANDGDGYCGTKVPHFPFPHLPNIGDILRGGKTGGTGGTGDAFNSDVIGGSSVVAILMQLANKERDAMYAKVDKLKNLKVPGENATPQEQAEYDKQKSELTSEIQQLQNAITQLTTMATNIQKTDHDTDMSIIRNFA